MIAVLVGAVIMVSYFGQGQDDLTELALIAGSAGFFTNGAIVGLYALFAYVFPTNVRSGGTGLVIGIGRGGDLFYPDVGQPRHASMAIDQGWQAQLFSVQCFLF